MNSLTEREQRHNQNLGGKHTGSRRPIQINYSEEFASMSQACEREGAVKAWRKEEKEEFTPQIESQ